MKILVADDDALIRRLLLALLGKLGHEVEAVENGDAAWSALESADPPSLAILDWVMPGLNGLEVCKRLRARPAKARPYVLLLSAKSDKQDVIVGLDAGADDYLIKPFDPMALLARLRVAQRILAYQQDLHAHIDEMERLLERHNLLGEMFGKQARVTDASSPGEWRAAADQPRVARSPRPVAIATPTPPWLEPERINGMFVRGLAEIGLGQAQGQVLEETGRSPEATFTAWAPLVLVKDGLWVDLLLDADEASAVAMFESLLGRIPASERELLDFLAETFNLLCTAMRTPLTEQGRVVLMPIISRSLRSAALSFGLPDHAQVTCHRLTLPNITLGLTVLRQPAPIIRKSLGRLHELDLLAENLHSPTAKEVCLLNQGVVLNLRYIEKLTSLPTIDRMDFRVPVIEPSPLTEFFCLGRVPS